MTEPFEPDRPTRVRFTLNDVNHTFEPGPRMMIQVQSSWFPLFDRNPQTWVEHILEAGDEDFAPATHKVYHSQRYASSIELPISGGCGAVSG